MSLGCSPPEGVRARRAALIFFSALLVASVARADRVPTLRERLATIIEPVAGVGFVGLFVASLTRGDALCAFDADRAFVPASNEKLQTSAAALAVLGPGHRFTTSVLSTAAPDKDGALEGVLILRGGGDPVLTEADLARLARAVREAGVTSVSGALVSDDSLFDSQRLGSGWAADDEPYGYSAQISALTCDRNVATVDVLPAESAGEKPTVRVAPLPDYLAVDNQATTGPAASPSSLEITRVRARNLLLIRGSTPAGGPGVPGTTVTVEDPARFTALLFRKALAQVGVSIAGGTAPGSAPAGARPVAEIHSAALADILPQMNKPSDNLIAEILLRDVGAVRHGQGSAAAGVAEVRAVLSLAGVDAARVSPVDGSGLSRQDLTSPHAIGQLLTYLQSQPYFAAFKGSLPVAGVDGTLRRRMIDTTARGKVFAKTGSLAHVSALSGYVTAAGGESLVFSLLTNNYVGPGTREVKRMEDLVAVALAEFRR